MALRDIKLAARAALHQAMQVPGYCYPAKGGFVAVDVRVHTEYAALGDVKGTSFVYAERRDTQDRLIFLAAQHRPARGDVVIISPTEGYRVDNVDPAYNITVATMVVALTAKELINYTAPPAAGVYTPASGLLPISAIALSAGGYQATIDGSAGLPFMESDLA